MKKRYPGYGEVFVETTGMWEMMLEIGPLNEAKLASLGNVLC